MINDKKTYSIGWYARDGYIDLFPLIHDQLKSAGYAPLSYYACNYSLDEEHLKKKYNIQDIWVLANYISNNVWDISDRALMDLETKYDIRTLTECIWGDKFGLGLSEKEIRKNLVAHFAFWESFIKQFKITILISESPSILSTCVAWIVCKKLEVDFLGFLYVPIKGDRVAFTTSWECQYEGLNEIIKNPLLLEDYQDAQLSADEYLKYIRERGLGKTDITIFDMKKKSKRGFLGGLPIKYGDLRNRLELVKRQKEYYLYKNSLLNVITRRVKVPFNSWYWIKTGVFHKREKDYNPKQDRYFLFPLHMPGEWVNYSFMGLRYVDQLALVQEIANCLPIGALLYVKEHITGFGIRKKKFYSDIKRISNVRLINPYEDTINLIKNCQGVLTLGSTVGYEAFLLKKPVFFWGKPWYEFFPGMYKIEGPEDMALLMQRSKLLPTANDSEMHQCVSALFASSFHAYMYPYERFIDPGNIARFSEAIANYFNLIRVSKSQLFSSLKQIVSMPKGTIISK